MRFLFFVITTFIATAVAAQKSLIVNGDFEKGNTGFVSDYEFIPPGVSADGIKEYFICNDAHDMRSQWSCRGKGNFMLVDGATEAGIPFWKQTINLNAAKKYLLSFDVALLSDPRYFNGGGIDVYFNNKKIATVTAPTKMYQWKVSEMVLSGLKTTKNVLHFEVMQSTLGGNDFGIDNIRLTELKAGYKPKTTYYTIPVSKKEQEEQNAESKIVVMDEAAPTIGFVTQEGVKEDVPEVPAFIVQKDTLLIKMEDLDEQPEIMLSIASVERGILLREKSIKKEYTYKYAFPSGAAMETLKILLHDNKLRRINITIEGVTKYFILNPSAPPVLFTVQKR
jgi:hypothetical protein